MILTCPECATSYFVDDARIPPQGRRVKCSSCGHRWWAAGPEGPIAEQPAAPPSSPEPESETAAEPREAAPPEDDLQFTGPEVIPIPRPAPAGEAQALRSEGRSSALVWAGAAAVVAVVIAAAMVFREDVVRLWPKSSAAYAGLGLPVSRGLAFEQVRVAPSFIGGRPVLSVTGVIRNVRDRTVISPPIRISLLDRAGKPVAAKIARPIDAEIPANSGRHFVIAILDPPSNASELEVRFEMPDGRSGPRAAAALQAPVAAPITCEIAAPPAAAPAAVLTEHG